MATISFLMFESGFLLSLLFPTTVSMVPMMCPKSSTLMALALVILPYMETNVEHNNEIRKLDASPIISINSEFPTARAAATENDENLAKSTEFTRPWRKAFVLITNHNDKVTL